MIDLGFSIEKRGDVDVLVWPDASCRPATDEESALWAVVSRAFDLPKPLEPVLYEWLEDGMQDLAPPYAHSWEHGVRGPFVSEEAFRALALQYSALLAKPAPAKVYAALYNPCVHESVAGVVSLHRSQEGADRAIIKRQKKNKRLGPVQPWERYVVEEMEVLP